MTTEERTAKRAVGPRFQPAADVLAGETADVYFERARRILAAEGMDPVVTMEIFAREEAVNRSAGRARREPVRQRAGTRLPRWER